MFTPDVAMPCLCYAWLGCAMPLRHRTIGSSRARTLVVPCVLTPHLPLWAIAHLIPTHFPPSPYSLVILSLLTFLHSPDTFSIPLSFPHRPSPILATFLSMSCVINRFLLTSPRKFAMTCVKRPVLRTSGWTCRGGGVCDEAVMKHCLFLPKISIFGHQNAGLV